MRVGGLGLQPSDSCYDANRSWYVPNFWIDDAECACIAAEGRPLGEQCASFKGTAQLMGQQVGGIFGDVIGGAATGAGEGIFGGLTGAGIPGWVVLAGIALGGLVLINTLKR